MMYIRMTMLLTLCVFCYGVLPASAQVDTESQAKVIAEKLAKTEEGWRGGGAFGADFLQTLLLNPRLGAGENRIVLGADIGAFASYKRGRLLWDNTASLKYGVQRLGVDDNPFQKTIDELLLDSKVGYQMADDSKWLYSGFGRFRTLITPTYSGNLLSNTDALGRRQRLIANIFSPALIQSGVGITYKPRADLSFFASPATLQMIVVSDDSIAAFSPDGKVSLHGNPWTSVEDYQNVRLDFGASFRMTYMRKFWSDKVVFSTSLVLFSNYLREPQNIDVDWRTQTDITLVKGLALGLGTILLYDHDVPTTISAHVGRPELPATGRRVSLLQQLTVKYRFQW